MLSTLERDGQGLPRYINCREADVIDVLYRPCLERADEYVRGAGYFRTSVFRLMTADLLEFCIRGGKMTIVTSSQMDVRDFEAAKQAYEGGVFVRDLEDLLRNAETTSPTEMLCALLHHGHLELYVALLREDMYHEKKGYFRDSANNIVAFDGSGNETATALKPFDSGNAENFNIGWSWHTETWEAYGSHWVRELQRVLCSDPTLTFPVVHIANLDPEFLHAHNIDFRLESHRQAAAERQRRLQERWDELYGTQHNSRPHQAAPMRAKAPLPALLRNLDKLRSHQGKGLSAWKEAGKIGILEHATGSGKTITAIAAIAEHLEAGGDAVVLVPSEALLFQWRQELSKFLPDVAVALLGAGHHEGKAVLEYMRVPGDSAGVVVSIHASFRNPVVLRKFERAMLRSGRPMLLVVDECHRLGADSFAAVCATRPPCRLGLSATPERQGDPIGTARLLDFLGPVVHVYGIAEALREGHLSPYDYFIRRVTLTADEQRAYDDLRAEIGRHFARLSDGDPIPDFLKKLLLDARRIIRGARRKLDAAVEILQAEYRPGQHWLVYCDSEAMLSELEARIHADLQLSPMRYWSGMDRQQRRSTLGYFATHGGVVLSIRCLDEGVDVPAVSHGIVLSSSKTTREFVQRRGRLLRKSKDKTHAVIFDTFALPADEGAEAKFVVDEISRAKQFADTARNAAEVRAVLDTISIAYDLADTSLLEEPEDDDDIPSVPAQ